MANFGDADGVGTGKTASQASLAKSDRGDPAVAILRETARQEGYRAGFESGRTDGLKAGQQAADNAARELSEQMAKAISGFDAGVADIERVLANEVLALSLESRAKSSVRRSRCSRKWSSGPYVRRWRSCPHIRP
jgi:hypothetical protein